MELLLNDVTLMILVKAKLFGIKYFDKDLFELMMRLGLTLIITYTIILKIFKSSKKDNEYLFTAFFYGS